MNNDEIKTPSNFIRNIIDADLASGKHKKIVTRFPPEPNGFLHIGHAKSICLNFGIARDYNGQCHLRFDDTNPEKEDQKYVDSIIEDVRWLGFEWQENLFHSSDYFGKLHDFALQLINQNQAYVCSLSAEEVRKFRGTLTEPGKNSPDRDRPLQENLDLFEKMRLGEFTEGQYTLRAKIDMNSPNLNLRDPMIYRIRKVKHQRTGDEWSIYPMYDFAHGLSDMLEGITHSICTLEFEDHRPLYDWYLKALKTPCHPQQIEFARLNLDYTVVSKRKLLELVESNLVNGWDDPRMPTISGMRRRGFPAQAIRTFCDLIGVTKKDSRIELGLLENCVRDDLAKVPRVMGVINPLKVVIDNYPDSDEEFEAMNHPQDPEMGTRKVPFSKEIYIERDDFMEDPPKKFFRLGPGREVRLRYAYLAKCTGFEKDSAGNITVVHCTYDPESRGGTAPDGRKVKGTIHWVSAKHAVDAEVRLYDRLFSVTVPDKADDYKKVIFDQSLVVTQAKLEPSLKETKMEDRVQFERMGYFCLDPDSASDRLVFNRTVTLRDSWAKMNR